MNKKMVVDVFHSLAMLEMACQRSPSALFAFVLGDKIVDVNFWIEEDRYRLLTSPAIHQLECLSIISWPVDKNVVSLLIQQGTLDKLRQLVLCGVEQFDVDAIQILSQLDAPNLESLDLSYVPITSEMLEVLFSWPQSRKLKSLTLSCCDLDAQHLSILTDLTGEFALEILNMDSNEMGDAGLEQLAQSPLLSNLKILKLDGDAADGTNNLGDEGLVALAQSPYLKHVEVLYLGGNEIGDAGVEALANAPWLANVRGLDLGSNQISDVGVLALASSPYVTSIYALDLGHNPLTDQGLDILQHASNMTQLKRLSVIWTQTSMQKVSQLKTSSDLDEVEAGNRWYSGNDRRFHVDDF